MAGSKRNMLYETDIPDGASGFLFDIINTDESNAKLTGGVEATPGNMGGKLFVSPTNGRIRKRRALLLEGKTADGKPVRRRVTVFDPSNALFVNGGTTVMGVMVGNASEAVTMFVSGTTGEARTFFKTTDSALDDGTAL